MAKMVRLNNYQREIGLGLSEKRHKTQHKFECDLLNYVMTKKL